ncbi:hypothetical protein ACMYR3_15850 [Ampullimonas aquatilis]|uniref:hypothetical protein n=1 Tax=Ampullimonas aquatilis TaxID=1341549 RepID=UPI003C70A70E
MPDATLAKFGFAIILAVISSLCTPHEKSTSHKTEVKSPSVLIQQSTFQYKH